MKTLSLLLCILLVLPLQAEVKAVIEGPTQANPGDLVVLTTTGSLGDNFAWIMPENLQVLTCDADQQIGFASGKPGVFRFTLIAADKDASIDHITHTVTITGVPPAPEPDPTDPTPDPDPDPTPAPDLSELTALSLANTPQDPSTQNLLKQSIHQVHTIILTKCTAGDCPSLSDAQYLYQTAISQSLLARPRGSQSDWVSWRKAIEQAIAKLKPTTVQELQNIMLAISWP